MEWPFTRMPGDGAVWPATVTNGLRILMGREIVIVPDISKTTVLGLTDDSSASRNVVVFGSLGSSDNVLTRKTWPPRPASVSVPNPIAPGKTGRVKAEGE